MIVNIFIKSFEKIKYEERTQEEKMECKQIKTDNFISLSNSRLFVFIINLKLRKITLIECIGQTVYAQTQTQTYLN